MSDIKNTLKGAFVTQLTTFNDELVKLFPEEKDFRIFKSAVNLLKNTPFGDGNGKIYSIFINYIEPYREKILVKDESFFLENEYDNVVQANSKDLSNIIVKLKGLWRGLSDTTKDSIWGYLCLMIQISNKIESM